MKPSPLEPGCALAFGFVGAPLITAFNVIWIRATFSSASPGASGPLEVALFALFLTAPLGFATRKLLEIWQSGAHFKARMLGAVCGTFALAFWLYFWLDRAGDPDWIDYPTPYLAFALSIPLLWSVLIPLCALFARAPRE